MCGRVLLRQGNVLRRHLRGQSIPLSRHLDVPASGCQVQPHMCENVVLRNAQASRERPAERQHGPSPALDAGPPLRQRLGVPSRLPRGLSRLVIRPTDGSKKKNYRKA